MAHEFDRKFIENILSLADDIITKRRSVDDFKGDDLFIYNKASALTLYELNVYPMDRKTIQFLKMLKEKYDERSVSFNGDKTVDDGCIDYKSYLKQVNNRFVCFKEYMLMEFEKSKPSLTFYTRHIILEKFGYFRERIVREIINITIKKTVIKKKDEEKVLDDVCGICYDNHTMIESVTTQCGHTFGNCCIQTWITTKSNRKEVVTCPYCINKITSMNGFRARPTPKSLKK